MRKGGDRVWVNEIATAICDSNGTLTGFTMIARELHDVALQLRPRALDDYGLEPALSSYVEDWSRRTEIRADLHAPAREERLPDGVETAIYRIVQEALTNVARHSGASRASVTVERRDDRVSVVVEDNGRGFETDRAVPHWVPEMTRKAALA